MRIAVVLVTALLALGACGDDGGGEDARDDSSSGSPSSTAAPADDAERLPVGKDDLPLQATSFLSPEGFAPELRLDLQFSGLVGWNSVHRGADGFDVGLPATGADAPLVAVAFLVPEQDSAQEVLDAVRDTAAAAGAAVKEVSRPFADLGATGLELRGGQGQVVASRDGGIALDAVPGGRLQVFATDDGGSPLVVVVLAPDASRWPDVKVAVERLSGAVTFAQAGS